MAGRESSADHPCTLTILYLPPCDTRSAAPPTLQGREDQQHTAGRLGARQGGGRGPGLPPAHRRHGAGRDGGHLRECRRHLNLTSHALLQRSCGHTVVAMHAVYLQSAAQAASQ